MKGWLNIMKKKTNRTNWKKELFREFGEKVGKYTQKNKGWYRYEDIYKYYTIIRDRNQTIEDITKFSHFIEYDTLPKIKYTLTKGGLKRKGKILKNSMVNLPTAVKQYVTNYIGIMEQFGFSGDLINRVKNLDNYKILLFSTFNASTIEYLYYEEPIKDKEDVINQALDDVEQMISDYESNGDIEQMKSEIAKKKFKKYGVVN